MKAVVCEMCNGHEFKKVDGLFVCVNTVELSIL